MISIASRGSALALTQARLVQDALAREGHESRIAVIETEGDRRAPDTAWGEGAFVAAIERALLSGGVDAAVHSAKDVPTDEDPRLTIAAYLPRADPRDALVVRADATERRLADLRPGTRIGTDSPRRTGFLLARRPDLTVHPLHGNVDTRLCRLDAGETDALVLACAGLDRLGQSDRIAERLDPELVPPAPGQGAIAIQIRRDDPRMLAIAGSVDDGRTRRAVEAERAFLTAAGGGCRAPIGALAIVGDGDLELLGGFASTDGARVAVARRRARVSGGQQLGRDLARELDARTRTRSVRHPAPERPRLPAPRVLVTRAPGQADDLVSGLREVGIEPVLVSAIAVEPVPPAGRLDEAARNLGTYAWVVITSANGARALLGAAERVFTPFEASRFAVVGPATRRALEIDDIRVAFQPTQSTSAALAAELLVDPGDRVLVVRGNLAADALAGALRERGAVVDDVIAYRTEEAPVGSRHLLRTAVEIGPIAAVALSSGSTVRGLLALAERESIDVRSVPAVCIGPETADEARAGGFRVVAVAATPDTASVVAAISDALVLQLQET